MRWAWDGSSGGGRGHGGGSGGGVVVWLEERGVGRGVGWHRGWRGGSGGGGRSTLVHQHVGLPGVVRCEGTAAVLLDA